MRIGLRVLAWMLGWVVLPLCGMAQTGGVDSLHFSAFEGQSRWVTYFPGEPHTVVLEGHWAYQLGGDTVLLGAYNPSAPEVLGLYVLVRDSLTDMIWKGIWKSDRSVRQVPDFYVMRPQMGIRRGRELGLVLEVESETPLGLYVVLVWDGGRGSESFLPVLRWSEELTGWEAARPYLRLDKEPRVSFPDGVYGMWAADGSVRISRAPSAWREDYISHYELIQGDIVGKEKGVGYTMPALGYVVVGKHKAKKRGKVAEAIAARNGLAAVHVFETDSAFTGHFLRYENPEVWEGVWKAGYLGEWRDGRWQPFVAEE